MRGCIQVQDYFLWCGQVLSGMSAEESIRDLVTCDLQLSQHQQLWAEMLARQETYDQALALGQQLVEQDGTNTREVRVSEEDNRGEERRSNERKGSIVWTGFSP